MFAAPVVNAIRYVLSRPIHSNARVTKRRHSAHRPVAGIKPTLAVGFCISIYIILPAVGVAAGVTWCCVRLLRLYLQSGRKGAASRYGAGGFRTYPGAAHASSARWRGYDVNADNVRGFSTTSGRCDNGFFLPRAPQQPPALSLFFGSTTTTSATLSATVLYVLGGFKQPVRVSIKSLRFRRIAFGNQRLFINWRGTTSGDVVSTSTTPTSVPRRRFRLNGNVFARLY